MSDSGNIAAPLNSFHNMPMPAVQALYYVATGKTLNASKTVRGSVVIKPEDIEQLYHIVSQQIQNCNLCVVPTVTVLVKYANDQSSQYPSWERYKALSSNVQEVTSEIILKFEFLIEPPKNVDFSDKQNEEFSKPQRYIINIDLDSGLPMFLSKNKWKSDPFIFHFMARADQFPTLHISIDYVDFIPAVNFQNCIEGWFKKLVKTPNQKLSSFLQKYENSFYAFTGQIDKIGAGIFLAVYVFLSQGDVEFGNGFLYSCSIGLFILVLLTILGDWSKRQIKLSVLNSVIPAIILQTEQDKVEYSKLVDSARKSVFTIFRPIINLLVSLGVNIAASYVATKISK